MSGQDTPQFFATPVQSPRSSTEAPAAMPTTPGPGPGPGLGQDSRSNSRNLVFANDLPNMGGSAMFQGSIYTNNVYTRSSGAVSSSSSACTKEKDFEGETVPGRQDAGWKAWSVVFGAFCCLVCAFGWVNSMGIFQDYYYTHQLEGYSESSIAWILSVQPFVLFSSGLVVGKLCDRYGPRYLLAFGTVLHILGLVMTSFGSQYWHFLLAHGICTPLGSGFLFYPATSSVNTWFERRRALAFGIVMSGASLGGIVFPAILTSLLPSVGFATTMRIGAAISAGFLAIANATVRSRIRPEPRDDTETRTFKDAAMEYVAPFRQPAFVLLSLGASFGYCSMFLPANFLPIQADQSGFNKNIAGLLLVFLNAGSWPGRILPTYFADKLGRFNMMVMACTLTTIFILTVWLTGTRFAPSSPGVFISFSALFGFSSGATVGLIPALLAQISPDKGIGLRQGVLFSLVALTCLAGGPIGGAIMESQGIMGLQIFNAGITVCAVICFVVCRVWFVGAEKFSFKQVV